MQLFNVFVSLRDGLGRARSQSSAPGSAVCYQLCSRAAYVAFAASCMWTLKLRALSGWAWGVHSCWGENVTENSLHSLLPVDTPRLCFGRGGRGGCRPKPLTVSLPDRPCHKYKAGGWGWGKKRCFRHLRLFRCRTCQGCGTGPPLS